MSIKTDLASLEILANIHRSQDLRKTFADMVHTLHTQVSYFDWVGVYLNYGEERVLEAASNMQDTCSWECNSQVSIPIKHSETHEIGTIVVKSKQPLCFDITDITTLQTLASTISEKLSLN